MGIHDVKTITPELRELLLAKLREESQQKSRISPEQRSGETPRMPLSFAQQRFLFLDCYIQRRAAYNVPLAVDITGSLAADSLEAALGDLVRRHEILRTTYSVAGGEQLLHPVVPLRLVSVDLGGEAGAEERATAAIRTQLEEPIDLESGPVLGATLYRLGPARHLLVLSIHHIATDGRSTVILLRDLEECYRARAENRPAVLPELPIQYADFAVWQRRHLAGPAGERLLAWWTSRLADPPQLALPLDRPRPPRQSYAGGMLELPLAETLGPTLAGLARREQVTPFAILLAALAALLYRMTGQRDLLVGAPFANRGLREVAEVVGCFVNTLPLRVAIAGDETASQVCRGVHQAVLEAQEHQDLPFERIVEEMGGERDPSHTPLYQVVLNFQPVARTAPLATEVQAARFAYRDFTTESAKFDLTLAVWEGDGRIGGNLVYDTVLFDAATAARLATHFARLLAAMAETAYRRIGELPMLTPTEWAELASGRFGRGAPATDAGRFGREAVLARIFEAQVEETPDAVAVAAEGEHRSYGALNRRANGLAHLLRRRGVGPETRVGLCSERSPDLVVAILGILKAGGAYVPLDPAYPQERLRFIAEDAGLALILAAEKHRERLPRAAAVDVDWAAPAASDASDMEAANPVAALPDSAAYVIYTSGSTGQPKGVTVSHRNVARLLGRTRPVFDFASSDVWSLFHSYAFDFSVWEIWGALLSGGRLVVVPYWVSRSPAHFRELCAREQVTVLSQSPTAFRQLLSPESEEAVAGGFPAAIRTIVFGAEKLDWEVLAPWFRRYGDAARLVNMYGITETTVHVTHRRVEPHERPQGSPIGQAIDDLDLYLCDDEGGLVPLGVAGEILVGGPGLARGYLGRPELTALRFVPNPFARQPGERLYRSGDHARWLSGGELVFLGRTDDQVKIRGFRIELSEVQAALAALPGVRDAVVLPRLDPEGQSYLAAYVMPVGDRALSARRLREELGRVLPDYMVPARIVPLEEAAADRARQARPPRPTRAMGGRAAGRRGCSGGARVGDRGGPGRHLQRGAGRRRGGARRQLFRPRRRLDPEPPDPRSGRRARHPADAARPLRAPDGQAPGAAGGERPGDGAAVRRLRAFLAGAAGGPREASRRRRGRLPAVDAAARDALRDAAPRGAPSLPQCRQHHDPRRARPRRPRDGDPDAR